MSLYGDYIKEREGRDIVESEKGFATYQIFKDGQCYLQDLYVAPEHRESHVATEMANTVSQIAKEAGCTRLVGSVWMGDKNASKNMSIFLKYGMRLHSVKDQVVYLITDLS